MTTPITATNKATKLKTVDMVLLSLLLDDERPPALSKFLYGSGALAILCELLLSIFVMELSFNPAMFWLVRDRGYNPLCTCCCCLLCFCMIFLLTLHAALVSPFIYNRFISKNCRNFTKF